MEPIKVIAFTTNMISLGYIEQKQKPVQAEALSVLTTDAKVRIHI